MACSFRRCRVGNRSIISTLFYLVVLVFVICLVSTQFSLGRPNEPILRRPDLEAVPAAGGHLPQPPDNSEPRLRQKSLERRDRPLESRLNDFNLHEPRVENSNRVVPSRVRFIPSQEYPLLAPNGKYVPPRRILHLDLKGGAYKPTFFPKLFDLFKQMKFTGVLIEWEDVFPYTGQLATALNGYAYTPDDVRSILRAARERELEIIPLVQTIGHLEWILKLDNFTHLRDDANSPQVICIGLEKSFTIIKDMIDQVARVHKEFGMQTFHMGADEVFQFGYCEGTLDRIKKEGTRDRALLWHLARVADYIKDNYQVTVLAWHDMFVNIMEDELVSYKLTKLIQPVLWSYAEDLDMYLPFSNWLALKPFGRVWGGSVFKGADGPMQYHSHPMHYVKNHLSWIQQFNRAYKEFERIEGLIYGGWSRYDHTAILCEIIPVAIPQLAFCAETMLEAKPLEGDYPLSRQWLGCEPVTDQAAFSVGCKFPGARIYELVNDFAGRKSRAQSFLETDYDLNGWMSKATFNYSTSSFTTINKIIPNIDFHLTGLEYIVQEFRKEMAEIYFQETIDEYVLVHMSEVVERLKERRKLADQLRQKRTYPKRPFIVYNPSSEL